MSFMTEVVKSPSLIISRQMLSTMYLNNKDFLEIGMNSNKHQYSTKGTNRIIISIMQREEGEEVSA